MEKRMPPHTLACLPIVLFTILVGFGCATEGMPVEPVLDSPGHHVESGFKLMEKGRLGDAGREFAFARQLDPKYSPAHRGLGLVRGLKGEFQAAFEAMELAARHAGNEEEEILAQVGFIRLHTMSKKEGWLRAAEIHFALAETMAREDPGVYYYMAMAYEIGGRFDDAEKAFRKVLEINRLFMVESYDHLKWLRNLDQNRPESELGREVAILDKVTRAQVAGLLIHELRLDEVYEKAREAEMGAPQDDGVRPSTEPAVPEDVAGHGLRGEIKKILMLDVMGLRYRPDGTFGPDEYVSRSDYATMIADIVVKVKGDPTLFEREAGKPSPYRDISRYVDYFDSIMLCKRYDLMPSRDQGLFWPHRRLSGLDALTGINGLKVMLGP